MTALLRIMGYVKKFKKAKILVGPTLPNHEEYPYDDLNNWHDLYPDAHFEVPEDALLSGLLYGLMLIMLGIK